MWSFSKEQSFSHGSRSLQPETLEILTRALRLSEALNIPQPPKAIEILANAFPATYARHRERADGSIERALAVFSIALRYRIVEILPGILLDVVTGSSPNKAIVSGVKWLGKLYVLDAEEQTELLDAIREISPKGRSSEEIWDEAVKFFIST